MFYLRPSSCLKFFRWQGQSPLHQTKFAAKWQNRKLWRVRLKTSPTCDKPTRPTSSLKPKTTKLHNPGFGHIYWIWKIKLARFCDFSFNPLHLEIAAFFFFPAWLRDPRTSPADNALWNAWDDALTAVSVAFVRFEIKMTSFNFSKASETTRSPRSYYKETKPKDERGPVNWIYLTTVSSFPPLI